MSIYSKPISAITAQDLQELLDEDAVENIRLEFKSEYPIKDKMLKALSSFANTYGGYMIVGAKADNGRLVDLPGVNPQPNYKQTLVQWCFDSISPPVTPFVSEPILRSGSSQVCYVIYMEESENGPHFLNKRGGCYIRTDEFNQPFQPRLAKYEEIQHLSNRRHLAVQRRKELFERSDGRFQTYIQLDYKTNDRTVEDIGATLKCAIAPRFPVAPLVDQAQLKNIITSSRIDVSGPDVDSFPMRERELFHQYESIIILNPAGSFSLLDANLWGQLYFAVELYRHNKQSQQVLPEEFVGNLLAFAYYAGKVYSGLGYNGSLQLSVRLERIRRIPFYSTRSSRHYTSRFDDWVAFAIDSDSKEICVNPDLPVRKSVRIVLYSIDWPDIGSNHTLEEMISRGYERNGWRR